jgi:tight adherence protein B
LAEAIDAMVGSLRAGATLQGSLDAALREAREPLQPYLAEVVGRINLGANPESALQGLVEGVPLEEFRLFSMTLATQWWVGGSMALTLSRVSRTIRDRVELSRRIRSQRVEAEISVVGVLLISYIVGIIIWRSNPEPTIQFLTSPIGIRLAALAVAMQAAGIVWIFKLGQIRF